MNQDFAEMLAALSEAGAEFMVIGVTPNRIDLRTAITGVAFADAWPRRSTVKLGGLTVPVIGREDLIRNQRAAGRPRDLADLADLEGDGR